MSSSKLTKILVSLGIGVGAACMGVAIEMMVLTSTGWPETKPVPAWVVAVVAVPLFLLAQLVVIIGGVSEDV